MYRGVAVPMADQKGRNLSRWLMERHAGSGLHMRRGIRGDLSRAQDGNACSNSGLIGAELAAASRRGRRRGKATGTSPRGSTAGISLSSTSAGANRTMPEHNPRRRFVTVFHEKSAALVLR
jgi:hypothetical protein